MEWFSFHNFREVITSIQENGFWVVSTDLLIVQILLTFEFCIEHQIACSEHMLLIFRRKNSLNRYHVPSPLGLTVIQQKKLSGRKQKFWESEINPNYYLLKIKTQRDICTMWANFLIAYLKDIPIWRSFQISQLPQKKTTINLKHLPKSHACSVAFILEFILWNDISNTFFHVRKRVSSKESSNSIDV